jgi:Ser/Thr protein kinase RdoA (MazF antagonist)
MSSRAELHAVLERYGLTSMLPRLVAESSNTHWILRNASERLVLRRYRAARSLSEIAYELAVLGFMAGKGWPVARNVDQPVTVGGRVWCVFEFLAGRSPSPRSAAGRRRERRRRGRLIAELHESFADAAELGQRPGWLRADEGLFADMPWSGIGAWFRRLEKSDPEAGRLLIQAWEVTSDDLARLVPMAPPAIVIHGDVVPWNLRYARGKLSGLLDFDLAHLDLRVAEFALAWRGRHDDVLLGYEDVRPLDPVERALVVPVFRAWVLACAACAVRDGHSLTWPLEHLARQPLTRVTRVTRGSDPRKWLPRKEKGLQIGRISRLRRNFRGRNREDV